MIWVNWLILNLVAFVLKNKGSFKYHLVCAVHKEVFSTLGEEYNGYIGGFHEYTGVFSTPGVSWVHCGDIMINVGGGHLENNWICLETLVYWKITGVLIIYPNTHHGIHPVYWLFPPGVHMIFLSNIHVGNYIRFWKLPFLGQTPYNFDQPQFLN